LRLGHDPAPVIAGAEEAADRTGFPAAGLSTGFSAFEGLLSAGTGFSGSGRGGGAGSGLG